MTFGSVIRVLVVVCLVGPDLTQAGPGDSGSETTHSCGGFSVRKVKEAVVGNPVQFKDELTNLGGWDNSTNIFTAPCKGPYFFTFNAMSTQNEDFTLALMKGDQYQVTAYGSKNGYQTGSNSALIKLELEDKVYLELQGGHIYESKDPDPEAYTTFNGYYVVEQFF